VDLRLRRRPSNRASAAPAGRFPREREADRPPIPFPPRGDVCEAASWPSPGGERAPLTRTGTNAVALGAQSISRQAATGCSTSGDSRASGLPIGAASLPPLTIFWARPRERSGRKPEREHVDGQPLRALCAGALFGNSNGGRAAGPIPSYGEPAGAASRQKTRPAREPARPPPGTSSAQPLSITARTARGGRAAPAVFRASGRPIGAPPACRITPS
jgi:hypothetical protein